MAGNWTEAEWADFGRRHKELAKRLEPAVPVPAIGHLPQVRMNKTESSYASYLEIQQRAGDVIWFRFAVVTIHLGPDCRFTPDFLIHYADGHLELHDTKGTRKIKIGRRADESTYYAEEDALVKARVTAAHFVIPIFFVFRQPNGEWEKVRFGVTA